MNYKELRNRLNNIHSRCDKARDSISKLLSDLDKEEMVVKRSKERS